MKASRKGKLTHRRRDGDVCTVARCRSAGLSTGLRAGFQLRQYHKHLPTISADLVRHAESQEVDRRRQSTCVCGVMMMTEFIHSILWTLRYWFAPRWLQLVTVDHWPSPSLWIAYQTSRASPFLRQLETDIFQRSVHASSVTPSDRCFYYTQKSACHRQL